MAGELQSSCGPRVEEAELPEILENREIHIELGGADSLSWPFLGRCAT
jgi:hypothetical protein